MKTYCRLFYQIPFSETDAMGIVHHSNHARYLERGRVEYLRLAGLSYAGLVQRGFHYPVTELQVSYQKPIAFDEVILVETAISGLTRVRLSFSYRIFTAGELRPAQLAQEAFAGKPSATGESFHCCINNQGRPIEHPAEAHQRFLELHGDA